MVPRGNHFVGFSMETTSPAYRVTIRVWRYSTIWHTRDSPMPVSSGGARQQPNSFCRIELLDILPNTLGVQSSIKATELLTCQSRLSERERNGPSLSQEGFEMTRFHNAKSLDLRTCAYCAEPCNSHLLVRFTHADEACTCFSNHMAV
jgi:hypothetical protein